MKTNHQKHPKVFLKSVQNKWYVYTVVDGVHTYISQYDNFIDGAQMQYDLENFIVEGGG